MIKRIIKNTFIFKYLKLFRRRIIHINEYFKWNENINSPSPNIIKQRVIKKIARDSKINVFIETGTYQGDMLSAVKSYFKQIYSIELNFEFFINARNRFKNNNKIEIIHGDSGIELGKLMEKINEPVIFWLDGHYSGDSTARGEKDTPIFEELNYIFNKFYDHIIIIDDARLFGSDPAYPSIDELRKFIFNKNISIDFEIKYDMIKIYNKVKYGNAG